MSSQTRADDGARPAVDVGVDVLVGASMRRGRIVKVTPDAGRNNRTVYAVRDRRTGRVDEVYRDAFSIDWR